MHIGVRSGMRVLHLNDWTTGRSLIRLSQLHMRCQWRTGASADSPVSNNSESIYIYIADIFMEQALYAWL